MKKTSNCVHPRRTRVWNISINQLLPLPLHPTTIMILVTIRILRLTIKMTIILLLPPAVSAHLSSPA